MHRKKTHYGPNGVLETFCEARAPLALHEDHVHRADVRQEDRVKRMKPMQAPRETVQEDYLSAGKQDGQTSRSAMVLLWMLGSSWICRYNLIRECQGLQGKFVTFHD